VALGGGQPLAIKSMSFGGVAMPFFDFFWNA